MELDELRDLYIDWIFQDCDTPHSEVDWLLHTLLASNKREDLIELLETFKP